MAPDETLRVIDLIARAAGFFEERGIENARLEVEWLLGHVLGCTRLDLYLKFDRPLSEDELNRFRGLYRRRLAHEPLQHLIGSTDFMNLTVKTDRRALIPRPETEVLVEHAVAFLKDFARPRVADLGTGTGVIALGVAYELPEAEVIAVDVSSDALGLARENAITLGLEDRVRFVTGSWCEPLAGCGLFDAILTNPPYIATGDLPGLPPEVREYDPVLALDGGEDGLYPLRTIAAEAGALLKPGGLVLAECGSDHAEVVCGLFRAAGAFEEVSLICDLAGRHRIVRALRGSYYPQ